MAEEDKEEKEKDKEKELKKIQDIHNYLNTKFASFYDNMIENLTKVLNIFEEYFGKDKVELQVPSKEVVINMLHTDSTMVDNVGRLKFKKILENNNIDTSDSDIRYNFPFGVAYKYSIEVFEEIYSLFLKDSRAIDTLFYNKNIDINIVVYYPNVTVTNEYNNSVVINKVFIIVSLKYYGELLGTFKIVRSEYSLDQLGSRYMFSHVPSLSLDNLAKPKTPCLGSGPISYTMGTLKEECDLDLWKLFCVELNNYIHNESVEGGPYISLTNIRNRNLGSIAYYNYNFMGRSYSSFFNEEDINTFIKYILSKKILKFNYNKGCFSIAMEPTKYLFLISNLFIEWYNELYRKGVYTSDYHKLINRNILWRLIYKDNKVYTRGFEIDYSNLLTYVGTPIIKFKGKVYTLEINNINKDKDYNEVIVLASNFISIITAKILKIVNYVYTTDFNANYSQTKFIF